MAQPIYHPSIEGAQHGAKSLAQFLDYAKKSGATGAQPSITTRVDLAAIGRSSGYRGAIGCEDQETLVEELARTRTDGGPRLLVVKTRLASARDVPRVSRSTMEIRDTFRRSVEART